MIRSATQAVRLSSSFVVAIVAAAVVYWIWLEQDVVRMPPGVLSGRGVLTAEETLIATPVAGWLIDLLAKDGDVVAPGAIVARVETADGEIRSIISIKGGRVSSLKRSTGDPIEAGEVLLALVDLAELHLMVPFNGRAVSRLKIGGEARIMFTDLPGRAVAGRVTALAEPDGGAGRGDAEGRDITATIDVTDARNMMLRPGFKAEVYVRTEEGASWPVFIR